MDLGIRPGPRPESFRIPLGTLVGRVAHGEKWPMGRLMGWGAILNPQGRMEKVAIIDDGERIYLYNATIVAME